MKDDEYRKTIRSLFRELPYFGVNHFVPLHGQFSNLNTTSLPTKKYLEKLSIFHDLDLFSLNTASNINPDQNLGRKPKLNLTEINFRDGAGRVDPCKEVGDAHHPS